MPSPRGGASATLPSDATVLLVGDSSQTDAVSAVGPEVSELHGARSISISTQWHEIALATCRSRIAAGSEPEAGFHGTHGGAGKRPAESCQSIPLLYSGVHDTWSAAPTLTWRTDLVFNQCATAEQWTDPLLRAEPALRPRLPSALLGGHRRTGEPALRVPGGPPRRWCSLSGSRHQRRRAICGGRSLRTEVAGVHRPPAYADAHRSWVRGCRATFGAATDFTS